MLLPASYASSLLLIILTVICWGSWANTQKLAGNWRFELYYYDYAFGVLLAAILIGVTFGSFGYDGFSMLDDFSRAGKREDFYAFVGGVVFNLANLLLVAAIAVAGMSVAFPIAIGVALIVGVIWNYFLEPVSNPVVLFTGAALVGVSIILCCMAFRAYSMHKSEVAAKAGIGSTRKKANLKGLVLSLVSGVLMGCFYPILQLGVYHERTTENGLGPYAIAVVFAVGVFTSTFVYNLFFMNLPVDGKPIAITAYLRGTAKQHILGILGGMIWISGTIASLVAAAVQGPARVGQPASYGLGQGSALLAVLWGVFFWRELTGADSRVRTLMALMFATFAIGLVMVSYAPLIGH